MSVYPGRTLVHSLTSTDTAPFVDEVIAAVKKRSFLPKARRAVHPADALLPSPALSATAQSFTPAAAPSTQSQQQPGLPIPGHTTSPLSTRGERSRKRRRNDRDASQQSDGQDHPHKRAGGGDRPVKQNGRMGARNGRGGHVGYGGQDGNPAWIPTGGQNDMPMGAMPNFAGPPLPPPRFQQLDMSNPTTFSQLDMSNPATFFQMMQVMQMGFPGMPGMAPVMPSAMNQAASNSNSNRLGQSENRQGMCKAYETQGACRDFACPYEHHGSIVPTLRADGTFTSSFTTPSPSPFQGASRSRFQPPPLAADDNPDTIPEYDPNHASLALQGLKGSNGQQGTGKGRGRSDGTSKGRPRASFSMSGPSYDRENSTVVVEQIPEEHFTEIDVRRYFSQFGNIVEVNMQAYKRLAVVKFDDYASARLAYDSPKAVFQNRFVKVYWYKPETLPQPSAKHNDPSASEVPEGEEVIDRVEIEKRQAEAQKVFEEKRKKAKEAEARAEEVERQLKEKEDQLRELRDQLAKKSKSASEADQEATLIDQLSSLQAEAQDLNADYGTYSRGRGRGRGRGGGFRGRGLYAPRARGGYRGRGYHTSAFPGGRSSVKRLDNRPKRIAISGVEVGTEKDEALRQHLLVGSLFLLSLSYSSPQNNGMGR